MSADTKSPKETAAKKTVVKRTAATKKPVAKKKTTTKKTTAKKTTVKKVATKKATAKKTVAKKATIKKTAAKKTAAAKKTVVKKTAGKKTAAKKTTTLRGKAKTAPADTAEKPAVIQGKAVAQESLATEVEAKKFEVQAGEFAPGAASGAPHELDQRYDETVVTLMVRDADWIFVYWEVDDATRRQRQIGEGEYPARLVLRWYDVTDLDTFNGSNAHRVMDVEVGDACSSWYQHMPEPNRCWCAEIGAMHVGGAFDPIYRSNVVRLPRASLAQARGRSAWMELGPSPHERHIFETPEGYVPSQAKGATHAGLMAVPGPTAKAKGAQRATPAEVVPAPGAEGAQAMSERYAETLSSGGWVSSAGLLHKKTPDQLQDKKKDPS